MIYVGSPPHNTTITIRHTTPHQPTHHHSQHQTSPPTLPTTNNTTHNHQHQPTRPTSATPRPPHAPAPARMCASFCQHWGSSAAQQGQPASQPGRRASGQRSGLAQGYHVPVCRVVRATHRANMPARRATRATQSERNAPNRFHRASLSIVITLFELPGVRPELCCCSGRQFPASLWLRNQQVTVHIRARLVEIAYCSMYILW